VACCWEREREREREKWLVVRDTKMGGEDGQEEYLLVLLVGVKRLIGIHLNLILWCNGAAFKLNLVRNLEGYTEAKNVEVTIGRDACEACRATWNFGTNSGITLLFICR
jgi:hypothetical protein